MHIFITGVTGVLGSAIAPLLLKDPDNYLHVLIRAKDKHHAQERLQILLDYWGNDVAENAAKRISVYCGDAACPEFGLDQKEYKHLLNTITHIVHSAASVKLDMSEDMALESVYKPSKVILDFALQLQNVGQLKKMEYVSTLGVAGKMSSNIPEEHFPAPDFHNTYEKMKYRAETEILAAYKEHHLPVTIHRPSMIVGHSQSGKNINFQGFYFLSNLLSGRHTNGLLPHFPQVTFDLVPSNYVAEAIVCSLSDVENTVGRIFHLCSGDTYVISYFDLVKYIQHYHEKRHKTLPKIKIIHPMLFLGLMKIRAFLSLNVKLKRSVKGISLYFKHIKTVQIFDNNKTRDYFESRDILLEYPENYLSKVFDYYRATTTKSK